MDFLLILREQVKELSDRAGTWFSPWVFKTALVHDTVISFSFICTDLDGGSVCGATVQIMAMKQVVWLIRTWDQNVAEALLTTTPCSPSSELHQS